MSEHEIMMLRSCQLEQVVMETAKWHTQDSSIFLFFLFFLLSPGVTSCFAGGAIFNARYIRRNSCAQYNVFFFLSLSFFSFLFILLTVMGAACLGARLRYLHHTHTHTRAELLTHREASWAAAVNGKQIFVIHHHRSAEIASTWGISFDHSSSFCSRVKEKKKLEKDTGENWKMPGARVAFSFSGFSHKSIFLFYCIIPYHVIFLF